MTAVRTGLPVRRALVASSGVRNFVAAKDVAMPVTPGASILLARPRTAFCSCSRVGMPRNCADLMGAKVG